MIETMGEAVVKRVSGVQKILIDNQQQLCGYVKRHALNPDDAIDVYQESIVRVLEQARKTELKNPLAYAIRVARNLLLRNNQQEYDDLDSVECQRATPETQLHHVQRLKLVEEALQTMPELRRRVFTLRRINGKSVEEISNMLTMNEAAVSKHIVRAMADIQRYLDNSE
ncbi:RNA polymerase sigma factor [Aestuariibacter sp. A3R04]|uniref:RNA polymerase sigma factor n=1 Tax=Aestuariibacter sp. A3R04 TaxID=2841571 RepID=UPI001C0A2066|nr:sigma-70 family RNA polymerase sigma factor [Aestuariibacter sp. A3R04]MBU3020671.1 sigma-70 family RNA polymerase sigma factor [Aestuariibacter sp. A3R04]